MTLGLLGLTAAAVLACGDDVTAPPTAEPPVVEPPDTTTPPLPGPCEGTGTTHAGSVRGEVWDSSGNPHRVPETISIEGRLTIRPGTVVCLGAGAAIRVRAEVLDVRGTEEDPVLLTPAESDVRWSGIESGGMGEAADTIRLEHVRLEEAEWGVRTTFDTGARLVIDHAHLRQIEGAAVHGQYVEIRHSVIDTACFACRSAAVRFDLYGRHVFEESVIRGSAGRGLTIGYASNTELLGGRIEGSAGTGLVVSSNPGRSQTLVEARPLRITGGAGFPIDLPVPWVQGIWPTAEDLDSLKGNAKDTLLVKLSGDFTVRPEWPTIVWGGSYRRSDITIEPGGTLVIAGRGIDDEDDVQIIAEGTPQNPVTLLGQGGDLLSPRLVEASNVRIRGFRSIQAWPLRLERFVVEGGSVRGIRGSSGASYLRGGVVRGGSVSLRGNATLEDVAVVGSPEFGVRVQGDATLGDCDVLGSTADGILVEQLEDADTVRVRGCNLSGNGGGGVALVGGGTVDARGNWWGDPAGPSGPEGDGVSGTVDYTGYLPAPADRDRPAVASIALSASSIEIPRSWVGTLRAEVLDSSGGWIPQATPVWETSGDAVVERVPGAAGLWRGLAVGEAVVTARSESTPSISATARVEVSDGPAVYEWARTEGVCADVLWGTSPTDVYAVCPRTIFHFDGVVWADVTPGFASESSGVAPVFVAASGTGPDDVYVLERDRSDFGVSATEWNRVLRFDGATWSWLGDATSPKRNAAGSIYAAGPEAVWIGGARGREGESGVELFDGSGWSWSHRALGICSDVWGFGPMEVYLACDSDVLRYDGSGWSGTGFPRQFPGGVLLWGTGGVLFARVRPFVECCTPAWRYAEGAWSEIDPVPWSVLSLGGNDPTDLLAGVDHDTWTAVYASDGGAWRPVFVDDERGFTQAVFLSGDVAFVSTGSEVWRGVR